MKAGNEDIVRYPRDDLERFTTNEGGNAYQSAEEWVTDEEATKRDGKDGKKIKKLICIEKWWRGPHVSQYIIVVLKLQ